MKTQKQDITFEHCNGTYKPHATQPIGFVTAPTLAAHLAVGRMTLSRWVKKGLVPSRKIGRVRRFYIAEVEQHLAERFSPKVRTR